MARPSSGWRKSATNSTGDSAESQVAVIGSCNLAHCHSRSGLMGGKLGTIFPRAGMPAESELRSGRQLLTGPRRQRVAKRGRDRVERSELLERVASHALVHPE